MIEMTLHAVTVRCETLTQALCLLDQWAQMGRISLPPAAKTATVEQIREASARLDAAGTKFPSVPPPAKPTARKAPGTLPEKECAVCGDEFTSPSPRTITCDRHRMKPGQKLADIQKIYARERAAKAARPAPDPASAKALLAKRPPIKPTEPTKPCSACGDKTRVADLDSHGRCRDCHPLGDRS